jgi:hypothetical protein
MAMKIERIVRTGKLSSEESARYDEIRAKVEQEFPTAPSRRKPVETGIGAEIHGIRKEKGLSWYNLARQAGIADAGIVRDIECARDGKLSDVEAIAKVLGLKLELVAAES